MFITSAFNDLSNIVKSKSNSTTMQKTQCLITESIPNYKYSESQTTLKQKDGL